MRSTTYRSDKIILVCISIQACFYCPISAVSKNIFDFGIKILRRFFNHRRGIHTIMCIARNNINFGNHLSLCVNGYRRLVSIETLAGALAPKFDPRKLVAGARR